jgi:hypothetical protein
MKFAKPSLRNFANSGVQRLAVVMFMQRNAAGIAGLQKIAI